MAPHWTERYVGMPYVEHAPGVQGFDCADLARLVLREVFGREIKIPVERDYSGLTTQNKITAMRDQVRRCMGDAVERLARPAAEGDCVIVIGRARMNHVGIYAQCQNEAWVLHNASAQRQVVLTRLNDFGRVGLAVEGVYAWT